MKRLISRQSVFLSLLLAGLALLVACGPAGRAIRYNVPNIDDYQLFPEHRIRTSPEKTTRLTEAQEAQFMPVSDWALGKYYQEGMSAEDYFQRTGTVAFLVLHKDTLQYEYYGPDYDPCTIFTSFSLSKVYVSTLVGIAIDEGHIDSIDQKVADFLPQFRDSSLSKIKIRHLLQMTSGLKSNESYVNPWAKGGPTLYYGKDLNRGLQKLELQREPGQSFAYKNINTQLMAMVLEAATGQELSDYLQEKLWTPLGMEADASWSTDEVNGQEKAFCCLNARARDYARFGLLMLNHGNWEGKQLVPRWWIREATASDTTEGSIQHYQYSWYTTAEEEDFYGQGLLGQFLYVCPEKDVIIVRLGKGLKYKVPWYDMFKIIAGVSYKPVEIDMSRQELKAYTGEYEFGVSHLGDSTLYGRKVMVRLRKGKLHFKTNFNQPFYVLPESDSLFFNLRWGRKMAFRFDEKGEVSGFNWERRGNSWDVRKVE